MFIRSRETIKDLFKIGKKYIKANKVFMYIHRDGKNVVFFYEKDGNYYNLKDQKISINLANYYNLSVAGRWGHGIADELNNNFVDISDSDKEKLNKITKYLQKGYKYPEYMTISKIDKMQYGQNKDNVMSWHKYNKKLLSEYEYTINDILKSRPLKYFRRPHGIVNNNEDKKDAKIEKNENNTLTEDEIYKRLSGSVEKLQQEYKNKINQPQNEPSDLQKEESDDENLI